MNLNRRTMLMGSLAASAVATMPTAAQAAPARRQTPGASAGITYCTYDHPFAETSLWNSIPLSPRLGTYQIPDTDTGWYPSMDNGDYGIALFEATAEDPAQTILPLEPEGIWDPDAETVLPQVTLPHFPSATLPPSGTDGAVAIHDRTSGIIYSFWQLRNREGTWRAKQMSWEWQCGQGWGDPDHYFKGASASGSANGAGVIRRAEHMDKDAEMYYHPLSMTLDFSALLAGEQLGPDNWGGAYVWPATSADGWGQRNYGQIPEGSLMMLPKDFPVEQLPSKELRKIARTLQTYGAYVVDRNYKTPFTMSVQAGIEYILGDRKYDGWDDYERSGTPQALDRIRKALRVMVDNDGYLAANGRIMHPVPGRGVDLLAMRGPWRLVKGAVAGTYNTFTRRLEFSDPGVTQVRTGRWERVNWALLKPGEKVKLVVNSTNGATLRLQVSSDGRSVIDTGELGRPGRHNVPLKWPGGTVEVTWTATSGRGNSWVEGDMTRF